MKGLSHFRRIHLLGIPILLVTAYFFPVTFWPSMIVYFGVGTVLVLRKLWDLDLPSQLRQLQAASVTSVFVAVLMGGIVSWFA